MAIYDAPAQVVVTHEGGLRFSARVRTHRITVDEPHSSGGDDAGPMPVELIAVSLASSVALQVQQFCAARGLPFEGMRVEAESQPARSPARLGRFDVSVILPAALPPEHEAMLARVAESSAVHHTLEHGAQVTVAIVTPAPAHA